jgi:two-component system NtrC family sensor kinase
VRLVTKRLATRLIIALTVLVAAVEGLFAWMNLRVQERQMVDQIVVGIDQLSRSITSATWHAMLADNREAVYQTMQTIAHKDGIETIRIFNKEGRVTFSTDPDAPARVDQTAEACDLCHAVQEPLVRVDVPSRARIFHGRDGVRRLGLVTPIYNEPACSQAACHAHPAERSVLGVLDLSMGLGHVDRQLADLKLRSILMTLTEVLLMGAFITLFTRRFVTRPIRRLVAGTQAVSAMQLDHPIRVEAIEELEELARSFNAMRDRLQVAMSEIQDFTERLEQKVEERSRQLSQAQSKLIQSDRLASLGQLAASVAHEINNPLSGVLNLSMLVRRILADDRVPPERVEEVRGYLAQISEETARVGRIVSDLLAFSRRSSPQRTHADLNTIIERTVTLVSHKLEQGGVIAELQLDPGLPAVPCDRSQIQQVIVNLVMNAAEATPSGGRVTVRTAIEPVTDSAVIEVQDTGCGIPEKILSRIFDPFFTTKGEGKGVGLGLSVVYGIVDAHDGSIAVASRAGLGTTFTVRLPLHPEPQRLAVAGAPPTAPEGSS